MTVRALALLVGLSLLAVGCRIDVGTDVAFDARGGGEVAVSVRIDGATLRELDRIGIDPALDVEQTLGQDSGWTIGRRVDEDGGLVLSYRQAFTDGEQATSLLRELSEDVAPQDPAIRLDLRVVTTRRGSVSIAGTGGISAPATLGVSLDDRPVGPTGPELEALVTDALRAELIVRVPGRIVSEDADAIADGVARWALPVGSARDIMLASQDASRWSRMPGWVRAAVLAVLLVLAVTAWRARRVSRAGSGAP